MQIFEVVELSEFPHMETREVIQGQVVSDILNETSSERVYLLVDHDTKRIWTFNGSKSPFKQQIYGGVLAGKLRQQLKLFYRVYSLNMYTKEDKEFLQILEKPIGGGRAKPIEKKDFPEPTPDKYVVDISVSNPKISKAFEYINQFPQPDSLIRRFMIIGGTIFTDEEITESFVEEEKIIVKPVKLGQLNPGFTFFQDHNYSTRLIIKERKIQGLELYVDENDISPSLKIEIPLIYEEKFNKPGSIENLIKAFQIPKKLPGERKEQNTSGSELDN